MSEDIDIARQTAIQIQQQKAQMEESTPDIMLQNLMIDDSYLKRILKGDIQEPLDNLSALIIECTQHQKIDNENAFKISELLRTINSQLAGYKQLKPFLMLLTPLMALTNLDEKQIKKLKRRVSIMVRRVMLDMDEDDLESSDVNFWEALKLIVWNRIDDSLHGWKANVVTEQKKIIETRFTEPPKKKRFGIF